MLVLLVLGYNKNVDNQILTVFFSRYPVSIFSNGVTALVKITPLMKQPTLINFCAIETVLTWENVFVSVFL